MVLGELGERRRIHDLVMSKPFITSWPPAMTLQTGYISDATMGLFWSRRVSTLPVCANVEKVIIIKDGSLPRTGDDDDDGDSDGDLGNGRWKTQKVLTHLKPVLFLFLFQRHHSTYPRSALPSSFWLGGRCDLVLVHLPPPPSPCIPNSFYCSRLETTSRWQHNTYMSQFRPTLKVETTNKHISYCR